MSVKKSPKNDESDDAGEGDLAPRRMSGGGGGAPELVVTSILWGMKNYFPGVLHIYFIPFTSKTPRFS